MKKNITAYNLNEIQKIEDLAVEVKNDSSTSSLLTKISEMFRLLKKSNNKVQTIRSNNTIKTLKTRKPFMKRVLQKIKEFNINRLFRPTKEQLVYVEKVIDKVDSEIN